MEICGEICRNSKCKDPEFKVGLALFKLKQEGWQGPSEEVTMGNCLRICQGQHI